MAQTIGQIRKLLEAHGLEPKHKWGQNFLHDQNHMQRIIEAGDVQPGELVLEVGAGTGSLTECLLEAGARVVAVEIDRALAPILQQRMAPFGERVAIYIGDVMADKRHLEPAVLDKLREQAAADDAEASKEPSDGPPPPFKLIANLPYGVASPLLSTLALDHPAMTQAVVMVQREVADRLLAEPGGKQYGPLGILVQAMGTVRRVAHLSPACFWPQPKVGSTVVHFQRDATPRIKDAAALASLVHTLFTKRRKQIGSILGRDAPLPEGIEPTMRPEQLSVAQLIALSEAHR
jgi:16S rRNA (adenine1518-N6/adenine1519-N6)-dimethyltransferase